MGASGEKKRPNVKIYVVIAALVTLILLKGALALLVVGDRGQPDWDYRPIPGTPAESAYGVYRPLPHPQHVLGAEGD